MMCYAAGIIVFKVNNDENIKFLGLKATKYYADMSNGIYDIPKGKIDPHETPFDCAKRECFEEAGIKPNNFLAGPYKCDGLWLWLAECDKNPVIGKNPHTGIKEHLGYEWLTGENLENNCFDYLVPGISWARKMINF
jgi:8-oxo-dGTP pyrophosphatase MutT (NUDIX family)